MNENLVGSTLSELYHRNLPHKILFTESADILPAFNDTNAYSADASLGLVAARLQAAGRKLRYHR